MFDPVDYWAYLRTGEVRPDFAEARRAPPALDAPAVCRHVGADQFVLMHPGRTPRRRLCGDCPVRAECLEYAMAEPDLVGTWGGTSERERRALRREAA